MPTVAVGGLDFDLPHVDMLANDNQRGGAARGAAPDRARAHRRIAHIAGTPGAASAPSAAEAYEDVMRAAGLASTSAVEAGDMTEEGGFRATVRLLSGPERPTAIFAANDLTCVGALSAATEIGVRVPGELSLVGFDNSVFARLRALWLTSVDAAALEMGRRAARMLLARIERPDARARPCCSPAARGAGLHRSGPHLTESAPRHPFSRLTPALHPLMLNAVVERSNTAERPELRVEDEA